KCSIASPRGSKAEWHALHDGAARCAFSLSRAVVLGSWGSAVLTPAGGGDGVVQRKLSKMKSPRRVGELRSAWDWAAITPAWPKIPARPLLGASSTWAKPDAGA